MSDHTIVIIWIVKIFFATRPPNPVPGMLQARTLEWVAIFTKELYKQDLNEPDNHDGVITHLEPDMLECEDSGP